jgi:RNA polymerase sigma-70 factor (ECF subfamily)
MRDAEGFAEFYRAQYGRVFRTATLASLSRAAAEDATHEAFARAGVRWSALRDYADPGAWVQRVALNLVISAARERRRVWRWRHELAPAATDLAADGGRTRARLLEELQALSPRQRAVVILYYLEDRPVGEVADALGVPAGTVKSDLARARKRLAASMQEADQ